MDLKNKFMWTFLLVAFISFKFSDGDGIRLPDQQESNQQPNQNAGPQTFQQNNILPQQQQQQNSIPQQASPAFAEGRRQGKDLLDLVGLGTGPNVDPYVAKTNGNCLRGDLAECFKTHALSNFDQIFVRNSYQLTDFARVIRTSENEQRALFQEPFEFSTEPRSADTEWDHLLKFGLRKIERFIKSAALEVDIPEELTEGGRYSPRFIDDIAGEIDVIEDKGAPLFKRHRLKKLFIPLLLVLKIFKLKLLLFLPFILGLVGLKKILGLAAIILPGLFAYFKLCAPQNGGSHFGGLFSSGPSYYPFQEYSPQGLGSASYNHNTHFHNSIGNGGGNPFYRDEPVFSKPYTEYYSKNAAATQNAGNSNGIRFGEETQQQQHHPQDLAYQGYSEYRNNKKEVS